MSSFKPIDPKRDEIRRYLERGNLMESLTKLFIRVINERPENPMEFIKNNFGVVRHQSDKIERLQKDLDQANKEIQRLKEIITRLNPEALKGNCNISCDSPQDNAPITANTAALHETSSPVELASINQNDTQHSKTHQPQKSVEDENTIVSEEIGNSPNAGDIPPPSEQKELINNAE